MQLFWKLKTFPQVFIIFYESTLNLEHFEKKKTGPYRSSISEVIETERRAYLNA